MAALLLYQKTQDLSTLLLCYLFDYTFALMIQDGSLPQTHSKEQNAGGKVGKHPLFWRTHCINNVSRFLISHCPKLNQKPHLSSKETWKCNIYFRYLYAQLKIRYFYQKKSKSIGVNSCSVIKGLQGSLPLTSCVSL